QAKRPRRAALRGGLGGGGSHEISVTCGCGNLPRTGECEGAPFRRPFGLRWRQLYGERSPEMFGSILPSCGQRSPRQKLTGPCFVATVLSALHSWTSAAVA